MKKTMRIMAAVLLIVTMLITAAACGENGSSRQMARINDTVITEGQLDKFSTLIYYIWGYDPSEMTLDEKKYFLDVMVECEVLRQYYEEQGENIYNDEYDSGKTTFLETAKSSEADFLKENGITDDDLIYYYRTAFVSQKFYDELRTGENEEQLNEDAKQFYEDAKESYKTEDEKRLSVIFVESEDDAKEIQKKASGGADFAKLAQEFSADPSSAENGGDAGFLTKASLDQSYGEGLFEMKVGSVSEPIQVDGGFIVVKITDENTSGYKTFDDVKDSIIDQLLNDAYTQKIEQIKADMDIEKTEIEE